jgi:predicted DNA-binding transcriptional regulator AlpA
MQTEFFTAKHLEERYGRSRQTVVYRWATDPELGFPQPVIIRKRKMWRRADVEAWDQRMSGAKAEAA